MSIHLPLVVLLFMAGCAASEGLPEPERPPSVTSRTPPPAWANRLPPPRAADAIRLERVKIGKDDPAPGCREIGLVQGSDGEGSLFGGRLGTYQGAYEALRRTAAARGADYVRMDVVEGPDSAALRGL